MMKSHGKLTAGFAARVGSGGEPVNQFLDVPNQVWRRMFHVEQGVAAALLDFFCFTWNITSRAF
jgi:hypothetical protein